MENGRSRQRCSSTPIRSSLQRVGPHLLPGDIDISPNQEIDMHETCQTHCPNADMKRSLILLLPVAAGRRSNIVLVALVVGDTFKAVEARQRRANAST